MKEIVPKKSSERSRLIGWYDKPLEHEVLTEIIIMSASTIFVAYLIVAVVVHILAEWIRGWGEVPFK